MDNSGIIALAVALEAKWGATISPAKCNRAPDGCLESLLKEVLYHIQPLDEDHRQRLNIISRFTLVLQSFEHLKGASVVPFGSFISNLYTRWGDLDISIEMPLDMQNASPVGKRKKIKILKELRQALLRKGAAQNVEFIPHARVPLLSFQDPYFKISCDVSIDNGSGLLKSRLLNWISQIDPRCRDLIFLVKYWAKAHSINDPKLGTLNSFSLTLLVIFHLQTRSPPIIPPFKDIYNGDIVQELAEAKGSKETCARQIQARCMENIENIKFHGFGADNRSSISDLFISFFSQYTSVEDLWVQGLTVCPFTGKWGDASISGSQIKKQYPIIIEDPFDHVENCARSVNESTLKTISDTFLITAQALQRPSVDMHSLRHSLFGCLHGRTKPNIKPSHVNSVMTSRKLEDNTKKGGSSQVYEREFIGTVERVDRLRSEDSLSATFSHGCSLDERSASGESVVIAPGHAVYRNLEHPAFENSDRQHHNQLPYFSGSKQPGSIMRYPKPYDHLQSQDIKVWKPKNGYLGF